MKGEGRIVEREGDKKNEVEKDVDRQEGRGGGKEGELQEGEYRTTTKPNQDTQEIDGCSNNHLQYSLTIHPQFISYKILKIQWTITERDQEK